MKEDGPLKTLRNTQFPDSKYVKSSKFKLFGEEHLCDENDGLKFYSFMKDQLRL